MASKRKKIEPYAQFKKHAHAVDFVAFYLDIDPRKVLKTLDRKSKAKAKYVTKKAA